MYNIFIKGGNFMNDKLVETFELTKVYKGCLAIENVSISLEKGKIYGLLGPNGAGKTTLIKILTGLIRNYSGQVKVNGEFINSNTRKIISYLPDHEYIADSWTIEYALEYYGDFFEDFNKEKAITLLQQLDIPLKKTFKSLSKGNKEKVQLILCLSRKAELYVFDEPIAGVDPAARDLIFKLIMENYNPEGSILISTHLISDAEQILDKYIFIKKGQIVQEGDVKQVTTEKNMTLDEIFREEFKCLSDY
jgi:ABC-2 type transport system ATP-binding protein